MGRLRGKVAIVTGASRGIGSAIAKRFLEEEAKVVCASRSGGSPECDNLQSKGFAVDVSCADDVGYMIKQTLDCFGGIDVLVNNAAVQLEKNILDTTEEEWDHLMGINLKGPFMCCRGALPHLEAAGGGSIINIGSYDGFVADPELAAYCASKGGVHALSRAIAVDHGKSGVRSNVIAPGWIKTEMMNDYLATQTSDDDAESRIIRQHPLGRLGKPSDIASLATWLASDESSFVTGQVYVVDGGLTAHAPYV
tara:strand:- start:698 stop:1453 length:756 start_codon:yes stop_codon:yes gene_type:complete